MGSKHAVMIGEWSSALSTGKLKSAAEQQDYIKAQLAAFNKVTAWFYWTYKTEQSRPWSLRSVVEDGLLSLD
jgi:aryl-phospho-beta-D-glucosidase BglC (GH1 family)